MAKKFECVICDDKFSVEGLTFNSAEHGINVCSDCAAPAVEMAVENEVARLVAKGIDTALAKKKAAKKDLSEKTVKIIREVLEADENSGDDDGDDDDVNIDDEDDETKPVVTGKKKDGKKEDKKVAKDDGASLETLRATLKELKAELKTTKKPEKVQAKIDETITEIKAEKKRLAGGGKVDTAKPNKTEKKPSTPKEPEVEDVETLTLEIEAAQIQRLISKAIKQAKEELASAKIKKGTDPAEVFAELATEAYHNNLEIYVKRISKLAAENGISIKAAIKKAVKDL